MKTLKNEVKLGVASCRATDVVQLLRMVRPVVLGAAHETVPAALPVDSIRWKKLHKKRKKASISITIKRRQGHDQ